MHFSVIDFPVVCLTMATETPRIMQRAFALMKHHAESEPVGSLYIVDVFQLDLRKALEGPYVDARLRYKYGRHSVHVHVRWDHINETYRIECRFSKIDEPNPETVLGVGGMFVKAGNLMRQLKALQ